MSKQKQYKPVLWLSRPVAIIACAVLVCAGVVAQLWTAPVHTQAATNTTINFQARLLTNTGSLVADGYYNVEFKLYSAPTGGSALWTETRTTTDRVRVVNGYLTVNLGSVTAFPSSIDWDQELWMTMNIGGITEGPAWDGEMTPRLKLTAVPHAMTSSKLAGGSGANRTVLDAGTPSGNNLLQLPAESGTLCVQNSAQCGFLSTASGVQLQPATPGTQQTGHFNISGTGIIGTALTTPVIDNGGTLSIGTTNATSVSLGRSSAETTISGSTIYLSGPSVVRTNNASVDDLQLTVEQQGSGDAGIEIKTPSTSYYMGIDASDSNKFKISSSQVSGGTVVMGYNADGGSTDSANSNYMNATRFVAPNSGTISALYARVGNVGSSPNNVSQMAIYSDSSNNPDSLLASSGSVALSANAWNLFAISSTPVTAGQTYWLVYNTNAANASLNNLRYRNVGEGTKTKWVAQTYGTWPSTWTGGTFAATEFSMYADVVVPSSGDNLGGGFFEMTTTGETLFRVSTDSANAFRVQDASGATMLAVNTSSPQITIGTSTSIQGATVGSSTALTVTTGAASNKGLVVQGAAGQSANLLEIQNSSSTVMLSVAANGNTTLTGSLTGRLATFRHTSNTSSAFNIQNAGGDSMLKVHTTYGFVVIGDDPDLSGARAKLVFGDVCAGFNCVSIFEGANMGQTTLDDSDVLQLQGAGGIRFSTDYTMASRMIINPLGQVGIGTEAPSENLTVVGNFNVQNAGTLNKQYRFRTNGSGLDLESGGADIYISGWTGVNFSGTQHTWIRANLSLPGVFIGTGSGSANPMKLILSDKNTSGDPGGYNGSMYYNSNSGRFRCYEAGEWKDCVSMVESAGTSNAAVSGTTTSASYVNVPGTSSLAYTKKTSASKLVLTLNVSYWATAANTSTRLGLRVDTTDYDCTNFFFNTNSLHMQVSCTIVLSGISAGSKTIQARWKRMSGTGTLSMDSGDWTNITVIETN